jgi:Cu2+-exporting ATPase
MIAGGAFLAGSKVYREKQKKKATPWIYYAEKMNKKKGVARLAKRQSPVSSFMESQNRAIKRVQEETASLFAPSLRSQQLQEVSSAGASISESEKKATMDLNIAWSSLAIATTGALFYPPLSLACVPGLVYVYIPRFKEAIHAIFKEREVKSVVTSAIITSGLLLSGQYLACALTCTFQMISSRLLVKAEDHSLNNIISLFGKQPRFVWLVSDGVEVRIPFDDLQTGDVIVVHAGEMIPVDGTISDGVASIDQRMLTGEAQPVEKCVGDQVLASTIVLSGQIHIKVERAGKDTVAAQITDILNCTTDFKKHIQWQWMEWLDQTALLTLLSSAISLPILGPVGALSVLYAVNFGYSMRIIAPLTLLNFLNLTSQNSILIKDGRALESLKQVDTIVFDKTGTLTCEVPTLSQLHTLNGYSEEELLTYAAAAEYKQTHPIALAILKEARRRDLTLPEIEEAKYEIGYGLKVRIADKVIRVGSTRFITMEKIAIPTQIRQIQERSHELGHSLVCVAINEQIGGAIELVPTIRPEAKHIVNSLRERGMSLYIISGDHAKPTQKLAEELGIEHYFAETLPENKASLIAKLQEEGQSVCFVGDGINDSIALKQANLSISLSGATSVAMDTAQIVLMDGSLKQLDKLFDIAGDFDKNMQTSFTMTTIPTILSISGVFLFNISIITTVFLYYGGLLIGVANSLRPLINQQKEHAATPSPHHQF